MAHPLADLFPLIAGDEFEALAEDIRAHGLRQPVVLYDGKVLDGRNRLRACEVAVVEPRFEVFDGSEDEALALVISLNLARRHLTTAQRAAVAVQLLPVEQEAARRRMHAGRPPAGEEPPQEVAEVPINGEANAVAGKRVGLSKETVRKAKQLAEGCPEVFEAMRDGIVKTMGEAERLAGLQPRRRDRVLQRMRDEGISLRQPEPERPTSNGSSEWYTPEPLLEAARAAMGGDIDLDPASHPQAQLAVRAARYYTVEDDGLAQPWLAERVWCNPPYGYADDGRPRQSVWMEKLVSEVEAGRTTQACLLIRAATETFWFATAWRFPVCFVRGRVQFVPGPGATGGWPATASAIVGVGVDPDAFARAFAKHGQVVLPAGDGVSRTTALDRTR